MKAADGAEVSIGLDWSTSLMANSSRDPYWQASVRRETLEHPESRAQIENECAICHMPMPTYAARSRNQLGELFAYLPFDAKTLSGRLAQDGVSCSVCHQITPDRLGTAASFSGNFQIDPPSASGVHPEFGPFDVAGSRMHVMRTSSGGFQPNRGDHIRQPELCASCHTLITEARGSGGGVIGSLHEQMPYQEWLHSAYRDKRTCQSCHMPEVRGEVPISSVLGIPRQGVRRHEFVAADFLMLRMLSRHRDELRVAASAQGLDAAAARTIAFLGSQAARVQIGEMAIRAGRLDAQVTVTNLGGHKLPTAFPSRRAWLHVLVRDRDHHVVFESGALNRDGSIRGNDNDADPARFEPHYREIRSPDEVEIYESILGDTAGRVTTGLLAATHYLKDDRLLPDGFEKGTAPPEIAAVGAAASDPDFTGGGDRIRYSVDIGGASGPFTVEVELWYQPIGYRWAQNLAPYSSTETRRFNQYYDSFSAENAAILARASAVR